jgi:hypothetical protein
VLCATIAGIGFSHAEVGKTGTQPTGAKKTSLRGVILTTNSEPITNATVTIKGVLAGRGAVYVFDALDCNRRTLTKKDGSFTFDGLVAETRFRGVVTAPGYQLHQFWDADPAGKPLEIKLLPAPDGDDPEQTVRGRVTDGSGKPITGAKIQVYTMRTRKDWHSGGGLTFTGDDGGFVFHPGYDFIGCDFTIEATGYVSRQFSEVPSGTGTNLYQLSQGVRLTGRLLKDGRPVPDAGIGIYDVTTGGFLNSFSTVTDAKGRFVFSGLPAHEEFYLFGIMRSLRELGALPRQHVKTGEDGTRIEVGDLNLLKGYTVSGRVQMADGKPTRVAAFTLARTEFTPPGDHAPTAQEESNRSFYGLEHSFDNWRADPGAEGKFVFSGVPGETVSIFLMLKPFDTLSSRNASSDGKGFRLLGMVASNKTDLVIELEPHKGQVSPPHRDYQLLSRQPLQGAEGAIAK